MNQAVPVSCLFTPWDSTNKTSPQPALFYAIHLFACNYHSISQSGHEHQAILCKGRIIVHVISQIIERCLYLAVWYMEQGCIRFVAKRQHVDKQFSESMWFLGFCTVHWAADLERFSHQCQNIDVNIKCSPALLKISTCLKGNGNRNLVTNVVTLGFGIVKAHCCFQWNCSGDISLWHLWPYRSWLFCWNNLNA